jgi:hypothetical protein
MKNIIVSIVSLFFISSCVTIKKSPTIVANTTSSKNDSVTISYLLKLDSKIQEAVVIGDSLLLDTALAKDFVFTHGFMDGGQEDKNKWRSLATKNPSIYFYRRVDSAIVELHEDIAIIMGTLSVKRVPIARRKETENYCYTLGYFHVYAFRNNRWQFLSHRTTKSITPSAPCK